MKKYIVIGIVCCFFAISTSSAFAASKNPRKSLVKTPTISVEDQRKATYYFYEAVRERQLKNYPEAAELLAKCYHINPNDAAVLYEFALLYTLMKQPQYALAYMENAMKKDPTNYWYKLGLAELFLQNKEYKLAIEVYENIAKYHPEKEDIVYKLVLLYNETGQLKKSLAALNKLEQLTGISEAVSFEKYRIYKKLKNNQKANAELARLIQRFPNEINYLILKGDSYMETKQYKKALACYLEAQQIDPGNRLLQKTLSNYYSQTGQAQKAKDLLKESFSNPKIAVDDKLALLADFLTKDAQKVSEAEEYFSILLTQYPDNEILITYYVSFLLMQDKADDALPHLQKLADTLPDNEQVLIQLLEIYLNKTDFEKVLELTNKAISLFPNNALWYYYKTMALFNFNMTEEALQICDQGIVLTKESDLKLASRFYGQKGDIYAQQNDFQKAFDAYELGRQADAKNIVLLNNYAYYLSVAKKDLAKAEQMSAQTIAAEPKNSTYLDTYAWIFFVQGNYTLAKLYIEQAIEYGGKENGVIIEHYADILYHTDNKEKAVSYWQKALELGNDSETLRKKIQTKIYLE
jgi:tetratricopeptide (TPR) repeat protein